MITQGLPLISVFRGSLVESVHRGTIVAVNESGRLVASAGDPHWKTYARSSAKLLQAIPVVASGAAARYGLSEAEIALICASHNGEVKHVEGVKSILAKLGLGEDVLLCGAHSPIHRPTAAKLRREGIPSRAVHNTCSGKHAGMLALAKHLSASLEHYIALEHPVQQKMLAVFSNFANVPVSDVVTAIDGCGAPVFGVPLNSLALAYARLGAREAPEPDARAIILSAIRAHPDMIAGDNRYDTALIRATNGRLIGKMGAEGVFTVTVPGEGLGLAVKIEDGAERALYPVVTEALLQLGWLHGQEAETLETFHQPIIRNWAGDEVGRIVPTFRLQ